MNSLRIWFACMIAAAARGTVVAVDLKADTSAEVTNNCGETSAWDKPVWLAMKERKASDITRLADVDLGYCIETADWSDASTGDKDVDAILRNTDFVTKMRILDYLEAK